MTKDVCKFHKHRGMMESKKNDVNEWVVYDVQKQQPNEWLKSDAFDSPFQPTTEEEKHVNEWVKHTGALQEHQINTLRHTFMDQFATIHSACVHSLADVVLSFC